MHAHIISFIFYRLNALCWAAITLYWVRKLQPHSLTWWCNNMNRSTLLRWDINILSKTGDPPWRIYLYHPDRSASAFTGNLATLLFSQLVTTMAVSLKLQRRCGSGKSFKNISICFAPLSDQIITAPLLSSLHIILLPNRLTNTPLDAQVALTSIVFIS